MDGSDFDRHQTEFEARESGPQVDLEELLRLPGSLEETFYQGIVAPTSRVLTTPSTDAIKGVKVVAEAMNLESTLRHIGAISAQQLANELEALSLRPSDFQNLELGAILAKRLAKALEESEAFKDAFRTQLGRRG